jgi:MerR family copper efflux transcriptional regulator
MKINEIASAAQVSVQTLRYYEKRKLVAEPRRRPSGYRDYEPGTVDRIRFIKRAQTLGFTLEEVGDLLALWPDSTSACGKAEDRATQKLQSIDAKIADLQKMRGALLQYVSACKSRPSMDECPLLRALSKGNVE